MLISKGEIIAELFRNTAISEIEVMKDDNKIYYVEISITNDLKSIDTTDYDIEILTYRPDELTYKIDYTVIDSSVGKYKMFINNDVTNIPGVHNITVKLTGKTNSNDSDFTLPFRIRVLHSADSSSSSTDSTSAITSIQLDVIKMQRNMNTIDKKIAMMQDSIDANTNGVLELRDLNTIMNHEVELIKTSQDSLLMEFHTLEAKVDNFDYELDNIRSIDLIDMPQTLYGHSGEVLIVKQDGSGFELGSHASGGGGTSNVVVGEGADDAFAGNRGVQLEVNQGDMSTLKPANQTNLVSAINNALDTSALNVSLIHADMAKLQPKDDATLTTSSKTIVGAINELQFTGGGNGVAIGEGSGQAFEGIRGKQVEDNIGDMTTLKPSNQTNLVSAINNALDTAAFDAAMIHSEISTIKSDITHIDDKIVLLQPITDNNLNTTDKTIVGAINEVLLTGGSGGSNPTSFKTLTDTPNDYTGNQGKILQLNATEDALEFVDLPTGGSNIVIGEDAGDAFDGLRGKTLEDNQTVINQTLVNKLDKVDALQLGEITGSAYDGLKGKTIFDTQTLIKNEIGDITTLGTTDKSNLVTAINEVHQQALIVPSMSFKTLSDTPIDYTGHSGEALVINTAEDALEFTTLFDSQTTGVKLGFQSGFNTQGTHAIALGYNAGSDAQGDYAIAIGDNAGERTQGEHSIAIGSDAGRLSIGAHDIEITTSSGLNNRGGSVKYTDLNGSWNLTNHDGSATFLLNGADPIGGIKFDVATNKTDITALKNSVTGQKITDLSDVNTENGHAPTNGQVLGWNATDSLWEPTDKDSAGAGGIIEAPNDGKTYGRSNEAWAEIYVANSYDLAEPADGIHYTVGEMRALKAGDGYRLPLYDGTDANFPNAPKLSYVGLTDLTFAYSAFIEKISTHYYKLVVNIRKSGLPSRHIEYNLTIDDTEISATAIGSTINTIFDHSGAAPEDLTGAANKLLKVKADDTGYEFIDMADDTDILAMF